MFVEEKGYFMKIGSNKLISIYEAQANSNISEKKDSIRNKMAYVNKSSKNDRIEISEKGLRHGEIIASKSRLSDEIQKSASDKIQILKDKISRGEYNVSSSDIAEAILKTKS